MLASSLMEVCFSLKFYIKSSAQYYKDFPGGSDGIEPTCNAGDLGSTPGSGRSPGEGNGYPLQYSYLEDPMDRGAWRAVVRGAGCMTSLFLPCHQLSGSPALVFPVELAS